MGSTAGSERFLGERRGNPLQYSCLSNPMDRGACRDTVHGVSEESDTTYLPKQQQEETSVGSLSGHF